MTFQAACLVEAQLEVEEEREEQGQSGGVGRVGATQMWELEPWEEEVEAWVEEDK